MFLSTVLLVILGVLRNGIWQWRVLPALNLFPYRLYLPIAIIVYFLSTRRRPLAEATRLVRGWYAFLAFWVLYAAALLIISRDITVGVPAYVNLTAGIIVSFLIVESIDDDRKLNYFSYLILGLVIFLCALGTWEHLTGNHLISSAFNPLVAKGGTRAKLWLGMGAAGQVLRTTPTGTFWNPNNFAFGLVILSTISVGLFLASRSLLVKIAVGLVLLWTIYMVALTGSRAALFVLPFVIVLYVLLAVTQKARFWTILAMLIVLAVGGVALPALYPDQALVFRDRIQDVVDLFTSGDINRNLRIELARNCVRFCKQTLGFGVGPGQARVWMEGTRQYTITGIGSPHNMWAEMLAEYGLLITIPFFIFYARFLARLFRGRRYAAGDRILVGHATAAFALMLCIIPAALSPSSALNEAITWTGFGYIVAVIRRLELRGREYIPDFHESGELQVSGQWHAESEEGQCDVAWDGQDDNGNHERESRGYLE